MPADKNRFMSVLNGSMLYVHKPMPAEMRFIIMSKKIVFIKPR